MNAEFGARRLLESAHAEADPVAVDRIEEQRRAAGLAEAAAHLLRRAIPGDVVAAFERHAVAWDVGARIIMAGGFAADRAVARVRRLQIAFDAEADRAAE